MVEFERKARFLQKIRLTMNVVCYFFSYLCNDKQNKVIVMSYSQLAQLEFMNAVNSINSESELNDFRDMLARYFAQKAQKAIDALWDQGVINNDTIEEWGEEHMRTPYQYETNRP